MKEEDREGEREVERQRRQERDSEIHKETVRARGVETARGGDKEREWERP